MAKVNIAELVQKNIARWNKATFKPSALALSKKVVTKLCAPEAKARYQHVEKLTGVPWDAIAMIHQREAGGRWDRQLGQGDPLHEVSIHVPKGRGPFSTWEEGAIDALVHCPPYAAQWKDWTPGGMLTLQELYNGLGYARMGRPSAYIWSGSNQYVSGKYVRDGVYDANVVDSQLGCAVMLKEIMEIDHTIYADPHAPDAEIVHERTHDGTEHVNPDDFPDPGASKEASDDDEQAVPPRAPSPAPARPATQAAPQEQNLPPALHKSKIAWLSSVLSFLGLGGVVNNLNDATLDTVTDAVSTVHDKTDQVRHLSSQIGLGHILAHAMSKPMTYIFLGIVISGALIVYFRWRDHGRGNPALTETPQ